MDAPTLTHDLPQTLPARSMQRFVTSRPLAADLFCCAGGASEGLRRAGFDVEGWDIRPQTRYPFRFHLGDALQAGLSRFDFVWASPPCQKFTMANHRDRRLGHAKHADLIPATRALLRAAGVPYVIENVPTAPLEDPLMLCGTMFGLGVFRHRHFESNVRLWAPAHAKHGGKIGDGRMFSVAGGAGRWRSWGTVVRDVTKGSAQEWRSAMGITWMTREELTQAIPPAYAEFLGRQILTAIKAGNAADDRPATKT